MRSGVESVFSQAVALIDLIGDAIVTLKSVAWATISDVPLPSDPLIASDPLALRNVAVVSVPETSKTPEKSVFFAVIDLSDPLDVSPLRIVPAPLADDEIVSADAVVV